MACDEKHGLDMDDEYEFEMFEVDSLGFFNEHHYTCSIHGFENALGVNKYM